MSQYRDIIRLFLKKNKVSYLLLVISLFLSEVGMIHLFNKVGILIDETILGNISKHLIFQEVFRVLYLLAVFIILRFIFKHLEFCLSNKGLIFMEHRMLEELLHKDYETINSLDRIKLIQKINNDCVTITDYLFFQFPFLLISITKVFIFLFIIKRNSNIAFISILIMSLVFLCIYFLGQKHYEELNKRMIKAQSDYFSVLGGELLNVFLVKVNCWYNRSLKKFNDTGTIFVKKSINFLSYDFFLSNIAKMLSMCGMLTIPLVVTYASTKPIEGIFVIILIIQYYFPTLEGVVEQLKKYSCYKNAKNRIIDIIDLPREKNGEKTLEKINEIILKNVKFSYREGKKEILHNLSYCFVPGNIYLITGTNGSGKTTLLNLLLGLLKPEAGTITFNNIELSECDLEEIRKNNLSFCEQEPFLVDGTIRENLNYNMNSIVALEPELPLLNFVHRLERGYDTKVMAGASNLSGGQKQRLALTRCLLKDTANVMIFDEPTSALDGKGVLEFSQMIKMKKQNRIIIIVSHDEELKEAADAILSLSA